MSIQKKSLISTLKTAKKANVASAPLAEVGDVKVAKATKASFSVRKAAMKAKAVHFARPARFS
jgi:hypothetical protein